MNNSTQTQAKHVPMPGTAESDTVQRIHETALAERLDQLGYLDDFYYEMAEYTEIADFCRRMRS